MIPADRIDPEVLSVRERFNKLPLETRGGYPLQGNLYKNVSDPTRLSYVFDPSRKELERRNYLLFTALAIFLLGAGFALSAVAAGKELNDSGFVITPLIVGSTCGLTALLIAYSFQRKINQCPKKLCLADSSLGKKLLNHIPKLGPKLLATLLCYLSQEHPSQEKAHQNAEFLASIEQVQENKYCLAVAQEVHADHRISDWLYIVLIGHQEDYRPTLKWPKISKYLNEDKDNDPDIAAVNRWILTGKTPTGRDWKPPRYSRLSLKFPV